MVNIPMLNLKLLIAEKMINKELLSTIFSILLLRRQSPYSLETVLRCYERVSQRLCYYSPVASALRQSKLKWEYKK